jgi:hypothetical protein
MRFYLVCAFQSNACYIYAMAARRPRKPAGALTLGCAVLDPISQYSMFIWCCVEWAGFRKGRCEGYAGFGSKWAWMTEVMVWCTCLCRCSRADGYLCR